MILLAVAAGGALGAVARYLLSRLQSVDSFPWMTLLINVAGSFLLAVLYRHFNTAEVSAEMRAFLTVGFCGAFTTFSTFSLEALRLFQNGRAMSAALYVLASVALCIAGAALALR